jgi:hypothetical protein
MLSREFRINKSAETAPAEKAEDGTPHELTNIRVQEVSMVDRAANRRKFLITKRDKKTTKTEFPPDVVVVDAADVVDLAATSRVDINKVDPADAARAKADKDAAEAAEREAELKLTSQVKADPPAEEPKKEAPPPAAEEPKKEEPPPAEEQPDEKTPVVDPITVTEEITVKAATFTIDVDAIVAKVGRPMRRERLERLKVAAKAFTDILAELDVDEPAEKAETKPEPKPEPAVVVVDTSKTDAEIQRLSSMVESLGKLVKDQGELLAKSRLPVESNTISLEKGRNGHDKVFWDADMASPQARVRGRSF